MNEPLRVMSIGAGAIGTYIGGSLALDGHGVVFVERPEVAERLRAGGFRLDLPEGERRLPGANVVGSIEEALALHDFDVALFALKSFDTPRFLESVAVPASSLPPFLCLANGVDNEPAIAAALGDDKVVPGTVTTAVVVKGPGHIGLGKLRGVGVARTEHAGGNASGSLSERLVEAMDAAGLRARLFDAAADMKWSKLLTNLLANATSAIVDMTPAEIFAHSGLYRLEIHQLREALKVMAARGTKVVDLPGIPVRLLAAAVQYLPPAKGGRRRPRQQDALVPRRSVRREGPFRGRLPQRRGGAGGAAHGGADPGERATDREAPGALERRDPARHVPEAAGETDPGAGLTTQIEAARPDRGFATRPSSLESAVFQG